MTVLRTLPHITGLIFNAPLLIAPARAEALVAGLWAVMRARGPMEVDTEAAASLPNSDAQPSRPRGYTIDKGVAVIPVRGVLVRRAGQMDSQSTPLQSYEATTRTIRAARSDPRVRGILLDIDSPGGEASGIFDISREVRAAADHKPTHAIANDDALSAAYAIGAAANRLWITDTGSAGSIGAVALHLDQSRLDEREGLRYTYIFKGAHKVDANPHGPLSTAAIGAIQGEVERLYTMLVDNVAQHRGTDTEKFRATEAAIYFGRDAVTKGLADRLGTLAEAHAELAQEVAPPTVSRPLTSPAPALTSEKASTVMNEQTRLQADPEDGESRRDYMARCMEEGGSEAECAAEWDNRDTAARAPRQNVAAQAPAANARDNIVHIDRQIADAIAARDERTAQILALCRLAKYPEMAEEFHKSNLSLAEVRDKLAERQVADANRTAVQAIDPVHEKTRNLNAELRAAVEARFKAQAQGSGQR